MAALRPGQMLEGTSYQVVRQIGAGGMGFVYEVEHVRLKKRYVAKTIHDLLENEANAKKRMEREAQVLASIEHPNIVQVHDFGATADGVTYFVMDKLQGVDLRRTMRTQNLSATRAVEIMVDVLDALDHVHRLGIVHRDIKPDNIFLAEVSATGGARIVTKVLDFGIAHLFGGGGSESKDRLTKTGGFVGTLYYAAPEQMQGKPAAPSNDVYGVGLVLFELIAKKGPFDDDPGVGLVRCFNPAPRLADIARAPIDLSDAVARALETDPARRPTASAFCHELRGILTKWRSSAPFKDPEEDDLDDLLAGIGRRHALEAARPAAGRRPEAVHAVAPPPAAQGVGFDPTAHADPNDPRASFPVIAPPVQAMPEMTSAPATPLMAAADHKAAMSAGGIASTMASPGASEPGPGRIGSSPSLGQPGSSPNNVAVAQAAHAPPMRNESIPHAPPRHESIPHAPPRHESVPRAAPMHASVPQAQAFVPPHAAPMRASVPQAAPAAPALGQTRPLGGESFSQAVGNRFESIPHAPARASIAGANPYGSVDGVQLPTVAPKRAPWGVIAVVVASVVSVALVAGALVYRSRANRQLDVAAAAAPTDASVAPPLASATTSSSSALLAAAPAAAPQTSSSTVASAAPVTQAKNDKPAERKEPAPPARLVNHGPAAQPGPQPVAPSGHSKAAGSPSASASVKRDEGYWNGPL